MSHPTTVELDVRSLVAGGQSPLPVILNNVAALKPGQQLRLLAPMEPTPLYSLLAERGLRPQSSQLDDGSWSVLFSPDAALDDEPEATLTVDVRGLPPPQPIQRLLEELEGLADGQVLLALTSHRPVCLLDALEEQDFVYESVQSSPTCWETRAYRETNATTSPNA